LSCVFCVQCCVVVCSVTLNTEDTRQTTTYNWAEKTQNKRQHNTGHRRHRTNNNTTLGREDTGQATTQHWTQKTQDKQQHNTGHRRHRSNNTTLSIEDRGQITQHRAQKKQDKQNTTLGTEDT
jgi:hypothetical protein